MTHAGCDGDGETPEPPGGLRGSSAVLHPEQQVACALLGGTTTGLLLPVFFYLLYSHLFSLSFFFFLLGSSCHPLAEMLWGASVSSPPSPLTGLPTAGWDLWISAKPPSRSTLGAGLGPTLPTEKRRARAHGAAWRCCLSKDKQNRSLLTASLLVLSSPSPWPASKWIITFNLPKFPLQIQL